MLFLASSAAVPTTAAARSGKDKCSCHSHALANGLFVRLVAKPGKEPELAKFLQDAQALAEKEPGTPLWFAVQFDAKTFAIFDAFSETSGREAHLSGKIAAALMAQASTLLAEAPKIEKFDVTAQKVHLGDHDKDCK
jgi:quinol monooxygenase YgiN